MLEYELILRCILRLLKDHSFKRYLQHPLNDNEKAIHAHRNSALVPILFRRIFEFQI